MVICFLRHGQTEWNLMKRIQGATSFVDLTDEGVGETRRLAERFANQEISFDRLYTSPLLRARRTAEIIGETLGLVPIEENRLIEMSFGWYEGMQYGVPATERFPFIDTNIRSCFENPTEYVPPPNAESFDDVVQRVVSFVEEMSVDASLTNGRILLVTHGGVICAAQHAFNGTPISDFWKGMVGNLKMIELDLENGRFCTL